MSQEVKTESNSKWPRMVRLEKVFGDPLRLRILAECMARETSPQSFHVEFGGATLSKISEAFELLAQFDWLERTRTERGGEDAEPGEVQHFYRATEGAVIDDETWADFPDATKAVISWRIVEGLHHRAREATKAGTMSKRDDRHVTWSPLVLDQQGWERVVSRVNELFFSLEDEQEEARARMAESGEEPVPVTVGLLVFESPRRAAKWR